MEVEKIIEDFIKGDEYRVSSWFMAELQIRFKKHMIKDFKTWWKEHEKDYEKN